MYRTHFHRQLAALYDAGNRQAIATEQIADAQTGSTEASHSDWPPLLSIAACKALFATLNLGQLLIGAALNHSPELTKVNSKLTDFNTKIPSTNDGELQNLLGPALCENLEILCRPIETDDGITAANALCSRVLLWLKFQVDIARYVKGQNPTTVPATPAATPPAAPAAPRPPKRTAGKSHK